MCGLNVKIAASSVACQALHAFDICSLRRSQATRRLDSVVEAGLMDRAEEAEVLTVDLWRFVRVPFARIGLSCSADFGDSLASSFKVSPKKA